MDEVKQLRRIGSITPGHPEYGHTIHGTLLGSEEIRAAKRAAPTGHGFTVARLARRVEETL